MNNIDQISDSDMVLDIHSKGDYPSDALSNFYPHAFELDGIACASMEGFLQSLKFSDCERQLFVCGLDGKNAKEAGLNVDWRSEQALYWRGLSIDRPEKAYQDLITRAYNAMFTNTAFRDALQAAVEYNLDHTIGLDDPRETILTRAEFIHQLKRLQARL